MSRWAIAVQGVLVVAAMTDTHADNGSLTRGDARSHDLRHTDTEFVLKEHRSLSDWEGRRAWLRDQVRFAAGLIPEPRRGPLNARIFGKLVRDGYTVEKVWFESVPGFYVTGNLYRPASAVGKVPAIVCPHGHWPAGRLNHDDIASVPARCITLARLGAVAFSHDMIGFNDSGRQISHEEPLLASPECALWGIGHLHLQTWNSIRAIDFLQSLPDVDPARIGAAGASGGGTQTFILAAIDDRVSVACPVNMISSIMQGGCVCENAPLLRIDTNNVEIAAVIAPRPMLLVSATGDWTSRTPTAEYPLLRSVYALYGKTDRIANVHVDAPHNFNLASRQAVYRFLARWLLDRPDADTITEGRIEVERPEDLLVFAGEQPPADMRKPAELVSQLEADVRERLGRSRPGDLAGLEALTRLVRFGLSHATGTEWPDEASIRPGRSHDTPATDCYTRSGRVVRVVRNAGRDSDEASGPLTIVVSAGGISGIGQYGGLAGSRELVMFAEPFGTGENRRVLPASKPRYLDKYFTTFNRTDAAEQVYDILTVVAAELARCRDKPAGLVGLGETGLACLVARAMMPPDVLRRTDLRAVIDMNGFDVDSDAMYVKRFFLPGIQRIGGLRAVAAVAASGGPVWLYHIGERFDAAAAQEAARLGGHEIRLSREAPGLDAVSEWLDAKR